MKLFNFLSGGRQQKPAPQSRAAKPLPRVKLSSRGAWQAAEHSRLTASWFTSGAPINQQIAEDLQALRARSRDLAKNSDYIRRFFQLLKTNVVGPDGFRFQSSVTRSNGKPDVPARTAVETGWQEFSKKGVPCAQDRLSLWDMQNLAIESLFRDGEVIILQYTGKDENRFGLSFKFIDPQVLDVTLNEDLGSSKIKMGIETDSRGRVTAYHFHSTDTTHSAYYSKGGKGYVRVAAQNVIHRFLIEYVDQIRGFPYLAAAMLRLKMLGEYEGAELTAARISAATMGFIERGEDGGSLEGARAVMDEDDFEAYPEEPTIEAEPGAFHYIENGAKIHEWSADHAPTAYRDFVKGVLRGVSSSLGVPYHSLANDLEGVNYSSIRTAVLEEREFWKALQNWMVENIIDPIFERWLETSLLAGALVMPNGVPLPVSSIDRYKAHSFTGRRWQWVDPLKDISAHEKAITLKLRTRSSIIREQGEDPEEVWRQLKEEDDLLKELGLIQDPPKPQQETPNDAENGTEGGDSDL